MSRPEAGRICQRTAVLTGSLDDDSLAYDEQATVSERTARPAPSEAFFDRGPGHARLSSGADNSALDWR